MLGSLLVAAVIAPSPVAADLKSLADRLHSTVLQVRGRAVRNEREVLTFGSGVLVGGGMAVTTLHAVAVGAAVDDEIEVLATDLPPMPARVAAAFPEIDLALLLVNGAEGLSAPPLAADNPTAGEVLIAMGAGENEVTVVGVTVTEVHDSVATLASPHLIDSRFWGGPLFDSRGELAGVSLTAITGPRGLTAGRLRTLMREATSPSRIGRGPVESR